MFLLASISFWTVRAQGIVWGYYNLFNIARMPDEAFGGLFKAVFTFAMPMLLVSNVPVAAAGRQAQHAHAGAVAAAHERCLLLRFGMGLARLGAPLHQRQFLTLNLPSREGERPHEPKPLPK